MGAADVGSATEGNRLDVAAETRSTKARLKEITAYIEDLDVSLTALKLQAEDAAILEEQASAALDTATSPAVSPFLGGHADERLPERVVADAPAAAVRGPSRRAEGHHQIFTAAPARRAVASARDGKPPPCAPSRS
ncbi:hypothetical protein [Streptomyces sp. NPDC057582]|uniref:hypothetical protein n=1 Tax=Streptomyces sp. NPDC057582 TaxID=3346174 RepID=UPI0036A9BBDF